MKDLITALEGKRTYICVSLIFTALIGAWLQWWPLPQELITALFAAGMFFLRAGIKANEFDASTIDLIQTVVSTVKPSTAAQLSTLSPVSQPSTLNPQPAPVPQPSTLNSQPSPKSGNASIRLLALLTIIGLLTIPVFLFSGCATLAPGADPLVVRCEQLEASSAATFNTALKIDDANRAFWRTNAPEFHAFMEYLRDPQGVGTNTLPRDLAWVMALDDVKQSYKLHRATSNDLIIAISTVETAVARANQFISQTSTTVIH